MTWPTLRYPRVHPPAGHLGPDACRRGRWPGPGTSCMTDPAQLWHANAFFPERYSYAFSDTLLGYAPLGHDRRRAPRPRCCATTSCSCWLHALAFFGAYALVRQLGAGRTGAAVAGGGLRLRAVAAGPGRPPARDLHRRDRAGAGHAGPRATAGRCGTATGPSAARQAGRWPAGWWRPGRSASASASACRSRTSCCCIVLVRGLRLAATAAAGAGRASRSAAGCCVADLVGGVVFAAVGAADGAALLQGRCELHPYAARPIEEIELFSPPLRGFFTAPAESWLWGARTPAPGPRCPGTRRWRCCPASSLLRAGRRRAVLLGLVAARTGCCCSPAAWSHRGPGDGHRVLRRPSGYLTALRHLPGWDGLRTPGRLVIWTTLLLGVLAAGAVSALRRAGPGAGGRPRVAVPGRAVAAAGHAAAAGCWCCVEGVNTTPHPVVPPQPAALAHRARGRCWCCPATRSPTCR